MSRGTTAHRTDKELLVAFLDKQIARKRRATKLIWIWGIVVFALVTCYMSAVVITVRTMLEPHCAAAMIANSVRENLPTLMAQTEATLQANAPTVADQSSRFLTETVFPAVRGHAEEMIDNTVDESLPLLEKEMTETLRAYIEMHEQEIAEMREAHEDRELADAFVSNLLIDLRGSLDHHIRNEAPGADITHIQTQSLTGLQEVRDQLKALLEMETDNMTREERLQRRIIVSWLMMVDGIVCDPDSVKEGLSTKK
jgi:hypothetical protein